MNHRHSVIRCRFCDSIIAQCRCIGPHEVVLSICEKPECVALRETPVTLISGERIPAHEEGKLRYQVARLLALFDDLVEPDANSASQFEPFYRVPVSAVNAIEWPLGHLEQSSDPLEKYGFQVELDGRSISGRPIFDMNRVLVIQWVFRSGAVKSELLLSLEAFEAMAKIYQGMREAVTGTK